ncbi:MAG: MBL fold metallo-hydrolase, partial [Patescibacteria group bacterium]
MAAKKIKITFCGGAGAVTGANFLLEDPGSTNSQSSSDYGAGATGLKVLVDCGLVQGTKAQEKINFEPFPYNPATIDAVFITHAHLDHIGRLPKLVKEGFKGKIYATPPTKEITELSLLDALGIMDKENKSEDIPRLFDEEDVKKTMTMWQTVGYHEPVKMGDFAVVLRDSGHILGSAMVEFTYVRPSTGAALKPSGQKIVFTGDLGNSPAPLLRDTEKVTDANYLIMESVYGDRAHEGQSERREKLEDIIEETMRQGGVLLIPAFSIERTQELLFEIENMMENSRIPLVPVFLDSPLAIKVTAVYKKYEDYLNKETKYIIDNGDGIFKFAQFHETMGTEESRAIDAFNIKKIIMAGSGMSNGGRIIHHEKKYLPDPRTTLLLAGYQGVGSLGRVIQDGAKTVRILGEEVPVNA